MLLIESLMGRNFDGVTLVVTFDMLKSFTVLKFWFSWVIVVLLPICEPLLSVIWEKLSKGVNISAPFLVKCFSLVNSSISTFSSVVIFITFARMNLFGFLRHYAQHSFRKIISCEISQFRKWYTLFPFKLSCWKPKNSTPFCCSFQVFPSNKKSADLRKMRLIYPFVVSDRFKREELFVFCILIWLTCFEILLLISLYIFVAKCSFTWIFIIAFSKTFSRWWFEVAFVTIFKNWKLFFVFYDTRWTRYNSKLQGRVNDDWRVICPNNLQEVNDFGCSIILLIRRACWNVTLWYLNIKVDVVFDSAL